MKIYDLIIYTWYKKYVHPLLIILLPFEFLYRCFIKHKRLYFISCKRELPKVPVIIVGNITLGGTGKTPIILWLITYFRNHGFKVGVISRGYASTPPYTPFRVTYNTSVLLVGDEALMIVQRSNVPLMIDKNRNRALEALLQEEKIDLILSDDGLQHYKLARNLELLIIDTVRGLGNNHCFPVGPLREPVERLQTVDAILYNCSQCNKINFNYKTKVNCYNFYLQPKNFVNIFSGEKSPLNYFSAGQCFHAIAGIGNPNSFFYTLKKMNFNIIPHIFQDHACYNSIKLDFNSNLPLIMTEKDAIKCKSFAKPNWWYLSVDVLMSKQFINWLNSKLETKFL